MEEEKISRQEMYKFLEEYLILKGVNPSKNFRCFSLGHEDKNPSMSFFKPGNVCKCFACGEKYDIFRLVGEEYGLASKEQQEEKVRDLYFHREKIININDGVYSKKNVEVPLDFNASPNKMKKKSPKEYSKYFQICQQKMQETEYLKNRGISEEVIRKYGIGYDPTFVDYESKEQNPSIIIPIHEKCFVSRSVEDTVLHKNRYRRIGQGLLGEELLLEKQSAIFVVEGEIDALSIVTVGGKAIASPTQHTPNLVEKIEKNSSTHTFYLMLDQDEKGKKTQEELLKKLQEKGEKVFVVVGFREYKDPNDFLQKNPYDFQKLIQNTPLLCELYKEMKEKESWSRTNQYVYSFQKKGQYQEEKAREAFERVASRKLEKRKDFSSKDLPWLLKEITQEGMKQYENYVASKELDDMMGFFQEEKKPKIPKKAKIKEENER